MKTVLTYFLLVCSCLAAGAEGIKDTVLLEDVVKVEKLNANPAAFESAFTDMKYTRGNRLADALGEYSSVFIKRYGASQLASLAIRGTSATQTQIEWNGVKINSPVLGQVDLALFHIGMQNEMELVRTGYKGTIGGTLMMNNTVKPDSGFTVSNHFRAGSFRTYEVISDAEYATSGFYGATKVCYLNSANNYSYRNLYEENHPWKRQSNATVSQFSFLQQLGATFKRNQNINVYFWLTDANREIPPIMSKPDGKENQQDVSMRMMADWKGRFRNLKVRLATAYLKDKIRYHNPDIFLDETTRTDAVRNNFSATYYLPFQLSLNAEINYDYETAKVESYGSKKHRNVAGLKFYADYVLRRDFRFHAGFREDMVDKNFSDFAPEFAFSYNHSFASKHHFSAGWIASRNFRFPTLNDLYWKPGGNPDLKQERSWNGDIQLKYAFEKAVSISVSNFYIYVSDWIQWTPQGSLWSPVNLKRVFSRGVEASLNVSNADENKPKRFTVHFNVSYSFTRTTNLDAISEFDDSKGKQVIYVPLHQGVAGLQLQYRRFYIRSVNRFTDKVFISTDNSQSLKGYIISDVEVGKDFSFFHLETGLSVRLNNLGNIQYQNVAQRPMPGRNYEVCFRFKFL